MKIPKDLKIPQPEFPSTEELLGELLLRRKSTDSNFTATPQIVEKLPDNFLKAIVNIATCAWRMRLKIMDSLGEAREELTKDDIKKIKKYTESIFDSLFNIEIVVKDRIGEVFDYGLPEKVVTTLPQPGLSIERIIETLRPTIYWRSQIAQVGEVVIATPQEAPANIDTVSSVSDSQQRSLEKIGPAKIADSSNENSTKPEISNTLKKNT